ncbi:alpha/beta fold hydrolase [Mucilaginibacter lappiensis]|uniref:alpha/beta fold hydrolase n=1 Tax=Mucilaginibacter lappiensis TaxID=354630 RepID=UPI003D19F61D
MEPQQASAQDARLTNEREIKVAEYSSKTVYKTVMVNGLKIFYREAGSTKSPTILLLHGFPSSSRMFNSLFALLKDHFHLIAPDYPGFGHSDYPSTSEFQYTFDHLAEIMDKFTEAIHLKSYNLYLQDYGGPIGMRMAILNPQRIASIIIQNAVSHDEGLSPLWAKRKAFWKDSAANVQTLIANFTSPNATRQRHIGGSPHPEAIDPDTWTDELAWLNTPGVLKAQIDLFYDYQNNVANYPKFQKWLRVRHPRLLVLWGRYDLSFTVAGAYAYQQDVPDAEIHILDAGHFALDEAAPEIASYIRQFLRQ